MKKKVAIFGTAADPIHLGHVETVRAASRVVDEVWVMPCWKHKYNKNMADPHHRLLMTWLSMRELNCVVTHNFEIKNLLSCGTYELLNMLSERYLDHEFSFVVGQDNADTIEKWVNAQKLIQEYSFIVVPRKGYKPISEWYNESPHVYLNEADIPDISSTEIRKSLAVDPQSVANLLHPDVFNYIKKSGLYKVAL